MIANERLLVFKPKKTQPVIRRKFRACAGFSIGLYSRALPYCNTCTVCVSACVMNVVARTLIALWYVDNNFTCESESVSICDVNIVLRDGTRLACRLIVLRYTVLYTRRYRQAYRSAAVPASYIIRCVFTIDLNLRHGNILRLDAVCAGLEYRFLVRSRIYVTA